MRQQFNGALRFLSGMSESAKQAAVFIALMYSTQVGCVPESVKQHAAEDAYRKALVSCSDKPENNTELAIDACHERVRKEWNVAPVRDAGGDR